MVICLNWVFKKIALCNCVLIFEQYFFKEKCSVNIDSIMHMRFCPLSSNHYSLENINNTTSFLTFERINEIVNFRKYF